MSYRATKHGFAAEAQKKVTAKHNPEQEKEVLDWIETVIGESLSGSSAKEKLKDGIALCKLINKLQPGSVAKINESKMAFKQMENISKFLAAIGKYGVSVTDTFQTVDLYEGQNMVQVICTIEALGRQKNNFTGPTIGVKIATENKREFTEEQLAAGQTVTSLQMGSNKGATASGINFGNTRHM
ncbi:uncharacterized protein TRIADDRAFT_25453 [Trichoplax adhaerens]|uniref:Calponin-homology (CH) domain-containing protein n=1 Tax=Trichoplax adhaerens TaxID=10228 RepID=B3RX68_TRIAD|nr:hypothetical protein TRIADDRAFT_25453 [Trichoplax adhaerens]EDV25254.1 hypothetical protein TRIADDRAFT_25453 [Trichoplax adhaerens]|eukprot:XP_002113144.1 hypothetical protein TRIADDRAFT_25453 [Trichoplax adhaerens]